MPSPPQHTHIHIFIGGRTPRSYSWQENLSTNPFTASFHTSHCIDQKTMSAFLFSSEFDEDWMVIVEKFSIFFSLISLSFRILRRKKVLCLFFCLKIIQCSLWVITRGSNVIPSYGWVNTEIWLQARDEFQSTNINHIADPFFPSFKKSC